LIGCDRIGKVKQIRKWEESKETKWDKYEQTLIQLIPIHPLMLIIAVPQTVEFPVPNPKYCNLNSIHH
jgi:hypothetical protein